MRLKNYLKEIFDTKVSLDITHTTPKDYQIRFDVDGDEWMFLARDHLFADDWEIFFYRVEETTNPWSLKGLSGGKAVKIFSGVIAALTKFVKEKDPEYFHFNAEGASRIKLYKKLAQMVERKSPYQFITTKKSGSTITFHFAK